MMLSLSPDTRKQPVYLKVNQEFFPGFEPDSILPNDYIAKVGTYETNQVSQQGFLNRAYWMLYIPESIEGTDQSFTVWLPDCPKPVYEIVVQIPAMPKSLPETEPETSTCSADLGERGCIAAGGTFHKINDTTSMCICP